MNGLKAIKSYDFAGLKCSNGEALHRGVAALQLCVFSHFPQTFLRVYHCGDGGIAPRPALRQWMGWFSLTTLFISRYSRHRVCRLNGGWPTVMMLYLVKLSVQLEAPSCYDLSQHFSSICGRQRDLPGRTESTAVMSKVGGWLEKRLVSCGDPNLLWMSVPFQYGSVAVLSVNTLMWVVNDFRHSNMTSVSKFFLSLPLYVPLWPQILPKQSE